MDYLIRPRDKMELLILSLVLDPTLRSSIFFNLVLTFFIGIVVSLLIWFSLLVGQISKYQTGVGKGDGI